MQNRNDRLWADLSMDKLALLQEAERTLGAELLMAYQPGSPTTAQTASILRGGWQFAPLNESQVECLAGLEKKLEAVVIAYQKTG